MRGFRLNGWQRIGIVLSTLWAVVGGLWGYHIATQGAIASPLEHYKSCISQPYYDDECSHTLDEEFAAGLRDQWAFAVTMAGLVPIPVAWLLVYMVVWTVRWIRRGFQLSA